jgi:glycerol-3-phosphate dehydrogenase
VRIAGGKYTTYRVMARDVIDGVLGRDVARRRPSDTADRQVVGAADHDELDRIAGELAAEPDVAAVHPDAAARLVARHGTESRDVVALGRALDLIRPLLPGRPFLEAEVAWAIRRELALTVDDVLSRRLRLSPEMADRGASVAPRVASIIARDLGWDDELCALEAATYVANAEREYGVPPAA